MEPPNKEEPWQRPVFPQTITEAAKRFQKKENLPTCGKCGEVMTPETATIQPEYFLHDRCLPQELLGEKEPQAANTVQGQATLQARELAIRALSEQNPRFTLYRNQDHTFREDDVKFWTTQFQRVMSFLEPQRPKSADASSSPKDSSPLSVILDEIEQRANVATPGPWKLLRINGQMGSHSLAIHSEGQGIICEMNKEQDYYVGNANLTASSRTDVPALVKFGRMAVQRLEESCSDAPATFAIYKNELTAILTQAK